MHCIRRLESKPSRWCERVVGRSTLPTRTPVGSSSRTWRCPSCGNSSRPSILCCRRCRSLLISSRSLRLCRWGCVHYTSVLNWQKMSGYVVINVMPCPWPSVSKIATLVFLDTVKKKRKKWCMLNFCMLIVSSSGELYWIITCSMTVALFQDHSIIEQLKLKCSLSWYVYSYLI